MNHLIAGGSYYRDEILQGYGTATLIASVLLVPFLLLLFQKRAFRIAATLAVCGAIPLAAYLVPQTLCPHYWEIILPLFLSLGVAALGITRLYIDRRFGLALAWYSLVSLFLFTDAPLSSASDLYGVLTKKIRTQAEQEQLEREIQEREAARLRQAPRERFMFADARLEDVIATLAAKAGIPYFKNPSALNQQVLVSFEEELSPFSALELITKEHGLELVMIRGEWIVDLGPSLDEGER